jgi:hypothetical protein
MKWVGYGLQGVGGVMAVAGMGVFALGKVVEHLGSRGADDEATDQVSSEVDVVAVL